MKVLMVSHLFPPHFSGAAIQAIELSRALKGSDYEPEFFTDNGKERSRWDDFQGLRVFRARTFMGPWSQAKQIVYTGRLLGFLIKHPEYKIVHFHSLTGFETLIFPLLKGMGRRVILELTLAGSDDPGTLKKRRLGPLFFGGLKRTDRLVAVSQKLVDLSVGCGIAKEKVLLIENGADVSRFSVVSAGEKEAFKAKLGYQNYPTVFMTMGKIEHRKGYDTLLEAWSSISARFPGAALLLIGPANTPENEFYLGLQRTITERGLKNVFFVGEVRNAEDYFKVTDCFLFCSRMEGFGTVLVEAMICGVPVVAMNIEGITENILRWKDIGRVCHSRSPEEFAGLVADLMSARDPQKVRTAAGEVRAHFDIRAIAKRYQALYSEIQ